MSEAHRKVLKQIQAGDRSANVAKQLRFAKSTVTRTVRLWNETASVAKWNSGG